MSARATHSVVTAVVIIILSFCTLTFLISSIRSHEADGAYGLLEMYKKTNKKNKN